MKKIKMSVEDLVVASFDVLPERSDGAGTVQGHGITTPWTVCYSECSECPLCETYQPSACYTRCPSCDTECATCPPC